MNSSFSRILSLLRKEKGLSQRSASADLGISQALLSHYENGIREPGLDFVVRVCNYYNVSADFLLGRTMSRELAGEVIPTPSAAPSGGEFTASEKVASAHNELSSSIAITLDLLGRSGNSFLIDEATMYMSIAVYKIFRHMYRSAGNNPDAFFAVPSYAFNQGADAAMKLSELRFSVEIYGNESTDGSKPSVPKLPAMSHASLEAEYPGRYPGLLTLLHGCNQRIMDIRKK